MVQRNFYPSASSFIKVIHGICLLSLCLIICQQFYNTQLFDGSQILRSKFIVESSVPSDTSLKATRSSTRIANLKKNLPPQMTSNQDNIMKDETDESPDTKVKVKIKEKKEERKTSCKNENGESVQWFFSLKLPQGLEYISYSSSDEGEEVSHFEDISTNSALRKTLDQYYGHEGEFFSIMYNDDPPNGKPTTGKTYAHAKGVIHCKDNECYFIQHSWPNFPPLSTAFDIGSDKYAQHFFCISLNFDEADSIFRILYYIHPKFYSPTLTNAHNSEWLQKIINKEVLKTEFMDPQKIFFSTGSLSAYFKTKKSSDIVWNGLSSLYPDVEFDITTWLSGSATPVFYDEEEAPFFKVISKTLSANDDREAKEWPYGLDHSKMAISRDPDLHAICFGDLNFVTDNSMRSGALYCYKNSRLYKAYGKAITIDTFKEAAEAIHESRPLYRKCKKTTKYSN